MARTFKFINLKNWGFTLVELLIVISILGVLATIALVSFRGAQGRSRDAQRKSDLKQISTALNLYYSDYGKYPDSSNGQIQACPYNSGNGIGSTCTWGTGEFTDVRTVYFKALPKDPSSSNNYFYRSLSVDSVPNQGFQIYAKLENTQDQSCLGGDCGDHTDIPVGVTCGGSGTCNFAVTSPNVTATE